MAVEVFDADDFDNHEQVVFAQDAASGLRAIIAIHNTNLGPALGGCRMWPYATQGEALEDVLRLSKGMTYKAAMAKVALGGGKMVVIADSKKDKTPELLHAVGVAIGRLGGRYITGEDIGTNPFDMAEIATQTECVSCRRVEDGGYGDPAPLTALGVLQSMKAAVERQRGSDDLSGLTVAVQGVGNVGNNLCRLLTEAGAKLIVTDIHQPSLDKAVQDYGASVVEGDAIFSVEADIFAPCAMGGALNDETIPVIKARIVAGAANNQLEEERHGDMLRDAGLTYMPDYVANGGGLISCAAEWYRHDADQIEQNVLGIKGTCLEVLAHAESSGLSTSEAADAIAEKRFLQAS